MITCITEYTARIRLHYLKAPKKEKGQILDEFTCITVCHRKAAIRLLRRNHTANPQKTRPGRPPKYGHEVISALKIVWEAGCYLTFG